GSPPGPPRSTGPRYPGVPAGCRWHAPSYTPKHGMRVNRTRHRTDLWAAGAPRKPVLNGDNEGTPLERAGNFRVRCDFRVRFTAGACLGMVEAGGAGRPRPGSRVTPTPQLEGPWRRGLNRTAASVSRYSAWRSRALPALLSRVRRRTLEPQRNSRGASPADA